jgi:hypothetical protein
MDFYTHCEHLLFFLDIFLSEKYIQLVLLPFNKFKYLLLRQKWSCISVLEVSNLPISTIFLLNVGQCNIFFSFYYRL